MYTSYSCYTSNQRKRRCSEEDLCSCVIGPDVPVTWLRVKFMSFPLRLKSSFYCRSFYSGSESEPGHPLTASALKPALHFSTWGLFRSSFHFPPSCFNPLMFFSGISQSSTVHSGGFFTFRPVLSIQVVSYFHLKQWFNAACPLSSLFSTGQVIKLKT